MLSLKKIELSLGIYLQVMRWTHFISIGWHVTLADLCHNFLNDTWSNAFEYDRSICFIGTLDVTFDFLDMCNIKSDDRSFDEDNILGKEHHSLQIEGALKKR